MFKKLVIASHNQGKVREIAELLTPYKIEVISASQLNLPEPEETGSTFAENAALKAVSAAQHSGLHALADDSGLAIPALDGAPGIYSARWGGKSKDFNLAMERVRRELTASEINPEGAQAYFVCSLALCSPSQKSPLPLWEGDRGRGKEANSDNTSYPPPQPSPARGEGDFLVEHFNGEVWGNLTFPPRGEKGFGYDPIFIPNNYDMTFAQMDSTEKHKISHRAKAFAKFVRYMENIALA